MDSLISIMAARTAATALDLGSKTIAAATKPFELILHAATQDADHADGAAAANDETDATTDVDQRVAEQLQELFQSLGLESGDRIELRIDRASGEIAVRGYHPAAAAIDDAIRQRPELAEDLRHIAELTEQFNDGFASVETELTVEVGGEGETAVLEWPLFG